MCNDISPSPATRGILLQAALATGAVQEVQRVQRTLVEMFRSALQEEAA